MVNQKYRVLLFDLGGVLVECNPFTKLLDWQTGSRDIRELDAKWQDSQIVRQYRLGKIGTKEFADGIIADFSLNVSTFRFLKEFRILPTGFYPGAEMLLKRLSKTYITAALSNTNDMHWQKLCGVNGLDRCFTRCYPSHLIHCVKPDAGAFAHVIKALKTEPSRIAFFDDREENVKAAADAGFDAFLTEGFDALCERLNALSLL